MLLHFGFDQSASPKDSGILGQSLDPRYEEAHITASWDTSFRHARSASATLLAHISTNMRSSKPSSTGLYGASYSVWMRPRQCSLQSPPSQLRSSNSFQEDELEEVLSRWPRKWKWVSTASALRGILNATCRTTSLNLKPFKSFSGRASWRLAYQLRGKVCYRSLDGPLPKDSPWYGSNFSRQHCLHPTQGPELPEVRDEHVCGTCILCSIYFHSSRTLSD